MRHHPPAFALLVPILAAAIGALALGPTRAELLPEQNGIDVGALLAPHGYTDVEVMRRRIDRVEAEACRDGGRWRVTLALLSGRARATERLGACAAVPATASEPPSAPTATASLTPPAPSEPSHSGVLPPWSDEDRAMRALERVGYTGVRIRRWGREGWRGTACRDGLLREVRLSADLRPAAPIRAMRDCPRGREAVRDLTAGPPEPPIRSVRDVKAKLVAKGYVGVGRIEIEDGAYHALACEGPWRFRVTVAPDGTVGARRNLGRCESAAAKLGTIPASLDDEPVGSVGPPADRPASSADG